MYILHKYICEKRNDYEELIGIYNQTKLQIISIMLTHDQIWNLHHIGNLHHKLQFYNLIDKYINR